jgi:hypothetical protein
MKTRSGKPRTYELRQDLFNKIDSASRELDIYPSELVNVLLTDALQRFDSGALKLTTERWLNPQFRAHRLRSIG